MEIALSPRDNPAKIRRMIGKDIHLWGVKQNNLKNIEVRVPLGKFTVVCGPSGSGKSSLAFETLYAEGQRRFIESMSTYTRQFLNKAPKPDIEGINNIPPSISIEQKNSVKNSRSTVGTTTELVDYLRLLYEKIGVPHCPTHKVPTAKQSVTEATDMIMNKFGGKRGYLLVEISAKNRVAQAKKLHALLLQDAYLRIFVPTEKPKGVEGSHRSIGKGEIVEISDPASLKKGLPKENFFLVIDRLAFPKQAVATNANEKASDQVSAEQAQGSEARDRLADSVSQAYSASVKYNLHSTTRRALVLTTEGEFQWLSEDNTCPECDYVCPDVTTRLLSFNSPLGACPDCKGFGNILTLSESKVIPNPNLSLEDGALHPFTMPSSETEYAALVRYCKKAKISLKTPWKDLRPEHREVIWKGNKDFMGVVGLFEYLDQIKYKMHVRVFIARYRSPRLCPTCNGARLRPEALSILLNHRSISELCEMTVEHLQEFFEKLKLSSSQTEISKEVLRQVKGRLDYLMRVGVHYLTLSRETRTLSGGEYQRIMLANQLGMGLSQTLYVLDEPTVGLHPRDNDRLISILKDIQALGNTLVVVEHDHDVIKNSDMIIEMGPGSGYLGGEVVYAGATKDFSKSKNSNTAKYLEAGEHRQVLAPMRPVDMDKYKFKIEIFGCSANNLKNIDVAFPLRRLVSVTGVSGSGKSTLVTKTLYPALARALDLEYEVAGKFKEIQGLEHIKNVLLIDQSSIGKSSRSSPITYLKAFDAIRTLMASLPEAKARGYTAGTFSLNVDGGRCPACKGSGFEEIDMMFMDNVILPCDVCDAKKYRAEILELQFKGKNIHEILSMTVAEAMNFFVAYPNIRKPLAVLKEVGLDYVQLGQPAATLSGGESQRLKIAKELSQVTQHSTLYILDEPTTGLHFREVQLLMNVLHKLIDAGGSVILIEHNQDVLLSSDYIIDIGPEAGEKGGEVVFAGSVEQLMKTKNSLTGQYLRRYKG